MSVSEGDEPTIRAREAEARAERATRRMRAIADAASGIVGARDHEALQEVLRGACVRVMELDAFVFALYDAASDSLSFLRIEDAGITVDPREGLQLSGTPAEAAVRERRSVVTRRSGDPVSRGAEIIGTGRPSESVIRTPIVARDRVLGVLPIQSYTPDLYTPEDVEVLESIAALAATALVNIEALEERRRAQTALRESEERFRQLAENVDQIFALRDVEADRMLYVSPAYERLWGRSRRSLYADPRSWKEAIHPEDRDQVEVQLRRSGGKQYDMEYRIVRPDGEVRWVRDRTFPVRGTTESGPRRASIAEDITESKAAHEFLRDSEASYRSLFDSVSELLYVQDFEGRFLSVNDAVTKRYGYSREELIGNTPERLADPQRTDLADIMDRFRRAAEGEPQRFEFWARTRDGESFPKEVSLSRGRYFGADVVIAVARDISDRKQAEARLAAAEAHYRRLVENAPYSIFALDRKGCFTELSPATADIIGQAPSSLIGKPLAALVVPDDVARVEASMRRLYSGAVESGEVEFRIEHASAGERLVHARSTAIREGGEVVGVHGIARDITAERRSQERTRMLAAALENLDEGVSIMRPEGSIVYANRAHARLLGYDPGARPLPHAKDLVVEPDSERLERNLRKVMERGQWIGRTHLRRMDDGQLIPVEVIHGAIDPDGADSLLFTITRDISGEIEEEQRLRRAERLASLGTLVGGVAHELNNPLQAIRSFAELLASDLPEGRPKEDLATIQREAKRAGKIVADLRFLARGTQDAAPQKHPVDLNEIARHVLNTRRYSLETRNIEIVEDLADELPSVMADRSQMEQVLLNLVVNAEQAMEGQRDGRTLTVRTRLHEERVALSVCDTGPGIQPKHLERIFDPFWTTKAPGEGTGLGLSLAYGIVTEHGGRIRVESPPGEGAGFHILLPAASDPAWPAEVRERADDADRPLAVLVVDDEPAIREVLARFLRARGHEVDVAAEGADALRMVASRMDSAGSGYDVIVSDLRMPGLGGEELFERLRKMGGGLERRVVFMTGDAVGGNAGRILRAMAAPVIYKPMSLDRAVIQIEEHAAEVGSGG